MGKPCWWRFARDLLWRSGVRDSGVSSGSNARPSGLEEVVVEEAAEHEHNDAVQHHQADLHQGVQRVQISCKAIDFII